MYTNIFLCPHIILQAIVAADYLAIIQRDKHVCTLPGYVILQSIHALITV